MRLLKILAVAVAVLLVFFVFSALLHILYLIGIGVVIMAAIFLAYKGWARYRDAQQRHEQRRQERMRERAAQRQPVRSIEPLRRIDAMPAQQPGPASGDLDLDEELARLRRELH